MLYNVYFCCSPCILLSAYHLSTISSKSMVIALALLDGGLSAEEAIACASLELDYQIDRFGFTCRLSCVYHQNTDVFAANYTCKAWSLFETVYLINS